MKKLTISKRFIFALFAVLVSVNLWGQEPTLTYADNEHPETAGTETNPYLITSSVDWAIFAYWINIGTNADKYYKLTANIQTGTGLSNDVTTNGIMVGTEEHPFQGTFDGDGFNIVFYYKYLGEDNYPIAPFQYTNNATIKNLNISGGFIKTGVYCGAGGLIGSNNGTENTLVNNVVVGVSIFSDGDYSGGFVVYGSHVTFTNCIYNGSFGSFTSYYAGGFCGYGDKTTQLNGCLYNPSSSTFWGENFVYTVDGEFDSANNLINCYYTEGDEDGSSTQGIYVYTIIPSNKIARRLTVINGVNVYDNSLISVDITFTNTNTSNEYTEAPYAEPITVGFTVEFDDVAVAPGEGKYKYTITDSYGGLTVQDIGEYTFKVEGDKTNNYYGSATKHFYVTAPDTYGNWNDLKAALLSSGEGNITLDRNYKSGVGGSGALIIDRNVEIDLNGFTIDRNLDEAENYGQVIRVNGGKTVTIIGPGIITGAWNKAINGTEHGDSNDGGGIYNMGNLTLDRVTIANNKCKKQNDDANNTNAVGRGGGIYSGKGSTLTMTNVIIRDNEAKGGGGGIFADEATSFTMSDCAVRSNESSDKGGGIRVKKVTSTITDCIINSNIVDNHTTESVANGGGIHLDEGTLTLTRCTINNNRAYKYGGGIYVIKGTINVNNCTLNYNMAYDEDMHNEGRGGGIYMHGGTLKMNGGSIQDNSSNKSYGGGIYINSVASFELQGSATITGNINYISGSSSSNNTNVYLLGASKIQIKGSIEGSSIGVATSIGESVFTTGLSGNGTIALFTSDDGEYDVALHDDEAKLVILNPWTPPTKPEEDGYYHINDAVAISNTVTVGGNGIKFGDNGSLTILPGGYLTADIINTDPTKLIIKGGQIVTSSTNVAATLKKDISAALAINGRFWYLISSGIVTPNITSNTNLIKMSANDYPEYDLYRFNESVTNNLQWENYRNDEHDDFTTLENGRGYLYRNGNDYTISISGTLNSADEIETNLTCTQPAEGTNVLKGFNIIGNPYPHNIKKGTNASGVEYAINNGELLENNYYVLLEDSTWELVNDGEEIHVMEGILVQAKKAGTLTISKIPALAPASKGENDIKTSNNKIWFTINNNEYKDRACVEFKSGHGLNKIGHLNEEAPMLYVNYKGENFGSVDMNPEAKYFDLYFEAKKTGMFTLSVDPQGEYEYLHLIDKLAGRDIDLLLENEYTFVGSVADSKDRFVIALDPSYSTGSENDAFAYQSGDEIVVDGDGELQIFDLMGRMIATQRVSGVEMVRKPSTTGVYIMRLNDKTQKIVVR